MSFESDIYHAHQSGKLDPALVSLFLPNGRIRNIEGPMWDYKVGFCHPRAVLNEEPVLSCELLHDIAALYNSFGGYLVVAFKDEQASHFKRFTVKDDFDKLADRYLRTYIPIAPFQTKANVEGAPANVLLIHVAKRSVGPPSPIDEIRPLTPIKVLSSRPRIFHFATVPAR
jgi:hypothetical protein